MVISCGQECQLPLSLIKHCHPEPKLPSRREGVAEWRDPSLRSRFRQRAPASLTPAGRLKIKFAATLPDGPRFGVLGYKIGYPPSPFNNKGAFRASSYAVLGFAMQPQKPLISVLPHGGNF